MKRVWNGMMEWKNYMCLMFTASVCVYSLMILAMGEESLRLAMVGELLLLSFFATLIQGVAFNENWLIRNMAYTKRMLVFVALFLPLLAVFAVVFQWFPAGQAASWLVFIVIFLVIFVSILLLFEIHFRIAGRRYDGLLGEYKKKKGIE